MSSPPPSCRTIQVFTFRGDRSPVFVSAFLRAVHRAQKRQGPGPSAATCLLYTGHTGVSMDGGRTVYGFKPNGGALPGWQVLERLKNGDAFPGVVSDDTALFAAARRQGLQLLTFEIILPDHQFVRFRRTLDQQIRRSQYTYGFRHGDGDCNCTTWLERLGLPLLTGRMDEFVTLPAVASGLTRKFGWCR